MGGAGSGRFFRPEKKMLVEDSLSLCSNKLGKVIKENPDLIDFPFFESIIFSSTRSGKLIGSLGYRIRAQFENSLIIDLDYTVSRSGLKMPIFDSISLQSTNPHFGGERFWFVCPQCKRRVGKLLLPPGSAFYRCRQCHDLTYFSCNESHRWDNLFQKCKRILS